MNKNEHKRNKELYYASNVVRNLGFKPNKSMCADCPDIILPSATNRKIGVEVVTYSTQCHEEAQRALQEILDEYVQKVLDQQSNKRYEIFVHLIDLAIPTKINYKKNKSQIFKELDSLIFPDKQNVKCKFLEQVNLMELPKLECSHIACVETFEYETLKENVLLHCIKQKEEKLKKYKLLANNKTIQEYYLAIFFPIEACAELSGYRLPEAFQTEYDRIYLTDSLYLNRIK